jgi:AraC-like DNA-binding protein
LHGVLSSRLCDACHCICAGARAAVPPQRRNATHRAGSKRKACHGTGGTGAVAGSEAKGNVCAGVLLLGGGEVLGLLELCYGMRENMDEDMKRGMLTMLLSMLKSISGTKKRVTAKSTALVTEIMKYVNDHLHERITLCDLAEAYGYEKSHFSRIFNRLLGMSLREYLNRCRLARVDQLLRQSPELSVSRAARECGFDSMNTYYRAKARFGQQKHNF